MFTSDTAGEAAVGVAKERHAQERHDHADDEEVSLSGSSFSDDDSSGDEGYDDSGVSTTDTGSAHDFHSDNDGEDMHRIHGAQSMDEFGFVSSGAGAQNKLLVARRASSALPSLNQRPPSNSGKTLAPNFFSLDSKPRKKSIRTRGYLDELPSFMDGSIPLSLTLSMARQHAQFARSCLELLNERDRQDVLRRRNVRRTLLRGNGKAVVDNDSADEEENDSCPLLTMIKAGPLYKLHLKGGKASKRFGSKRGKKSGNNSNATGGSVAQRGGVAQRLLTKWKPKYVEVRKGILSYYGDSRKHRPLTSSSKEDLVRMSIPLQASTCVCRAVDYYGSGEGRISLEDGSGTAAFAPSRLYAFELTVQGLPSRLFAAGTEAARQDWIRSINRGMLGRNNVKEKCDNNGGNLSKKIQSNGHMQKFRTLSQSASTATTSDSYIDNFARLLWGSTIEVPMLFLEEVVSPSLIESNVRSNPTQTGLAKSPQNELRQFWHELTQYNVSLNGCTLRGKSTFGAERTFGALMRCILEQDKSRGDDGNELMAEIQAARYTRDVLKVLIDGYKGRATSLKLAVKALCNNQRDLVVIGDSEKQSSSKEVPTININVSSHKGNDSLRGQHRIQNSDRREWIHVRTSKFKSPKRCFVVLSVGVLCFYRRAYPRPHNLIGQLFLVGAKVGFRELTGDGLDVSSRTDSSGQLPIEEGSMISSEGRSIQSSEAGRSMKRPKYTIFVSGKGKNGGSHHLCFTDYEKYSEWRDALIMAIESCSLPPTLGDDNPTSMDELWVNERHPPLASAPTATSLIQVYTPARLATTFESDKDGITWITLPSSLTPESPRTRSRMNISSRLLGSSPFVRSFGPSPVPSLSALQFASSRLIMGSGNSITTTISSVRVMTAATRRLPFSRKSKSKDVSTIENKPQVENDGMLEDSVVTTPSDPTVEIETSFSSFHHLYTKNDGAVLATIRATCIQRFHLPGGGAGGKLEKRKEIIKLETLRGAVRSQTFDCIFDVERPRGRRATI